MPLTHGFELLEERTIPEINSLARLYRHARTGAELISVINDDENKVFGITFRTPVSDSTGVPHILEHGVLCGSRKYPLKDPFIELAKGSLNTFLNAFTYPDKTCYPIASQNLQDFYNLVDVYLDAVFYPLIPPLVLMQEGWRHEIEDGRLVYKGIVFNEMKGAYSSPDSVLRDHSQFSLFPGHPYSLDAGGDPEVIPSLTYAQYKGFHERYYHPSNSRIWFYGDDDPEKRLELLDGYLVDFQAIPVDSAVPLHPQAAQPARRRVPYDAGDDPGARHYLTVNWLLPEVGDPQQTLGLAILEHILIGTPASPLRKALVDSGLGDDLAGAGLESELRQMTFSTGLKGVAPEHLDQVERLVLDTLAGLARDGVDPQMVAAALNTVEFRLRENNTGAYPRGLLLMLRSLTTWLHGDDPFKPLAFEAPLAAIKARLEGGQRYFEGLIQAHLVDNQHRAVVILDPDPELSARRQAAEDARLAQAQQVLTAGDVDEINRLAALLRQRQETPDSPEALATIPSLKLSDLEPQARRIPSREIPQPAGQLVFHDLFTNGILYLDVGFDLRSLPPEWLPYIPLYAQSLLEIGTEGEDYVRLSQRIGRETGGIQPATLAAARLDGGPAAWLFLRGKATVERTPELLAILNDVLFSVHFDNRERFRQMALEARAGMETQLVPIGHRIANRRLRARFNLGDWALEQMEGVSQLFFLRRLVEQIEQDWPAVLAALQGIHRTLLTRGGMLLNATLDAAGWARVEGRVSAFLAGMPAGESRPAAWQMAAFPPAEGLTIPAQVNYVAKGANLYDLGYTIHGSALVANHYLRSTYLYERVRLQGGAYGGFSVFDRQSGVFTYVSYRDPNLLGTLENYDNAAAFLSRLEIDEDELTRAIIGVIGELDAYQLPDAKGYTSLTRRLLGISDEERQRLRDEILGARLEHLRLFGEHLAQVNRRGQVVVLGSPEAIQAANAVKGDWLQVSKAL
jgi:hypothetical protein